MKTIVLKFGGTSVGTIDRIKKVCKIIAFYKKKKNSVVVVSSAMSGVTNELVNKSKLISDTFDKAEFDALEWARDRAYFYGPLDEQLDQLYHDIDAGKFGADAKTGSWFVGITSVKNAYPKP